MDNGCQLLRVGKDIKKHRQARVYLNEENEELLRTLAENQPDLEESKLMTILISAALRAAKRNHFRLPMPLAFTISEEVEPYSRGRPSAIVMADAPRKK